MKRNIIIIATFVLCLILLASCKDEQAGFGSLRLCFGEELAKTIVPDTSYTGELNYYELQLTLPNGEVYKEENIRTSTMELDDLPIGEYQLVVYGYRDDEEDYKAKGNMKFRLYQDDNTITVPLTFVGNGSLKLIVRTDRSKLEPKYGPSLNLSFYDKDMNKMEFKATSTNVEDGGSLFTGIYDGIPSGTYTIKLLLKQRGKVVSTLVDTILIMPNTTTSGDVSFTIGDSVNSTGISIISIDNKSIITGSIKTIEEDNSSITYGVDITDKPEYIDEGDIQYTWLVNGDSRGNDKQVTVTSADLQRGLVFVAVVLSSNVDGVIGSASTTASF